MSRVNGMESISCIALSLTLAGCGGLSVTPNDDKPFKSGYPVYAPMVVVNVESRLVCVNPDEDGKCPDGTKREKKCVIGAPYLLPDYGQRYIVDFKRGLGSYTGTVAIKDGWMLTSMTSTANPAAFLSSVGDLVAARGLDKCEEGIYKLDPREGFVRMVLGAR